MYGTLKMGKLDMTVTSLRLVNGALLVRALAVNPKRKHIPTKCPIAFTLSGEDGQKVAIGLFDGSTFKDAYDRWLPGCNLSFDMHITWPEPMVDEGL